MNYKLIVASAVILFLSACANTQQAKEGASQASNNSGYRCKKAIKVGSHITSKRCTTKAQRDREKKDAQETMNSVQRGGTRSDGSSF